jgi:hypothetical protein
MNDIKVNDQVLVRKKIRTGTLIRFGFVVRTDGDSSLVHFPLDHSQAVIPTNQLEKTSTKFSMYARVQNSPTRRSF